MKRGSEYWLCLDCMEIAVNGDATSLDYYYSPEEAQARLDLIEANMPPNLVPDFDEDSGEDEFSRMPCDCCDTHLEGSRYRFVQLVED